MHTTRTYPHKSLLLPLALAVFTGCQDRELPTGVANGLTFSPAFSQVATSPVVNSLLDDGDGSCTDARCTLRDAIAYASAGATITFDLALTAGGPAVIILTQGELFIQQNLTVTGPGATSLSVSANNNSRVSRIGSSSTVSISGLTLTQGRGAPIGFNGGGGAIFNQGVLTLAGVTVSGNTSGLAGGGIANWGTLTVVNSTISGNSTQWSQGGGIANEVVGSTLFVTNSTITGNSTGGHGGGIYSSTVAVITNSTISGNSASEGAGIYSGGALTLMSSTVSANGGVGIVFGIEATVTNTIVAGNAWDECYVDRNVEIVDGGYNIDGGTTCGFEAATSRSSTDPKLGPLAYNGGPTKTHALLAGSPAIDAGTCTDHVGATVNTDQRGYPRPASTGCDIGAFEFDASPAPPPPSCEGVQIQMKRTAGPDPVAAGQAGNWTVELEVSACEAVTGVSAQGGGPAWVTITASTSDGSIGVRKVNKNSQVWFWEVGALAAGDVVKATLGISGTVGKKVACGSEISLTGDWSATANAGAGPAKYGEAGPLTVQVCASEPPPPPALMAPVAANDEYSLTAGQTLNVLAASGLLANDALGSPGATITAVLGADGEPLGSRTVLDGTVEVNTATGAFTLTGATRAGTEWFQYEITNSEGTSRGDVVITVNPGAAASMVAYAGDGQTGIANFSLLIAPAVRVTDAFDNAIAAASVAFAVTAGGGSATGLTATTTSEGVAAVGSWTLGGEAGVNTLRATLSGLTPLDFTATAVTSCSLGTPTTAAFSAISQPTTNNDNTQTRSVTLLVTDGCGSPVIGASVSWAAPSSLSSTDVVTGSTTTGTDGLATASWTYYYSCGTHTVSATAAGLPAVHHTLDFGTCGGGGGGSIRR